MASNKSTKKKSSKGSERVVKSVKKEKKPAAPSKKSLKKISDKEQVRLLEALVEGLAGLDSGRIVSILYSKKDVNEFFIAKKMDLTINQVRNILYKLSAEGLVSFIRKKDKRKGWYIYYWTLNTEKCLVKLEQTLLNKIDDLKALLGSRETKRFYVCKPCGIEVGEEKALEHGFTCEECAEVYELADNTSSIREAKAKITRTERDLEMILAELIILREVKSRKAARVSKKEDKILAKEKAKKLVARRKKAAAKKILMGKSVKPKKKPAKAKGGKKPKKRVVRTRKKK